MSTTESPESSPAPTPSQSETSPVPDPEVPPPEETPQPETPEPEPEPEPENPEEPPTPEPSPSEENPARRRAKRTHPGGRWRYGRQEQEPDEAEYPVPADMETSVGVEGLAGYATDSSEAMAMATTTLATTALFYETVVNGQTTTAQATQGPSGTPTATEVVNDPPETTVQVPTAVAIFTDLPETTMETAMSTWEEIGTVSMDMATPTLSDAVDGPAPTENGDQDDEKDSEGGAGTRFSASWSSLAVVIVAMCALLF